MSITQGSEMPKHKFNPLEENCFARYINKTDEEVSKLIRDTLNWLDASGEYDQGDETWDRLMDLATVANYLWAARRG